MAEGKIAQTMLSFGCVPSLSVAKGRSWHGGRGSSSKQQDGGYKLRYSPHLVPDFMYVVPQVTQEAAVHREQPTPYWPNFAHALPVNVLTTTFFGLAVGLALSLGTFLTLILAVGLCLGVGLGLTASSDRPASSVCAAVAATNARASTARMAAVALRAIVLRSDELCGLQVQYNGSEKRPGDRLAPLYDRPGMQTTACSRCMQQLAASMWHAQVSLAFVTALGRSWRCLQAAYVGSRGAHLFEDRDVIEGRLASQPRAVAWLLLTLETACSTDDADSAQRTASSSSAPHLCYTSSIKDAGPRSGVVKAGPTDW